MNGQHVSEAALNQRSLASDECGKVVREPDLQTLYGRLGHLLDRLEMHGSHLDVLADRLYGPVPQPCGTQDDDDKAGYGGAVSVLNQTVDQMGEALDVAEYNRRRLGDLA